MITYEDLIVVKLVDITCGFIRVNPGGFYYLPLGAEYESGITKVYPTLERCKAALESE